MTSHWTQDTCHDGVYKAPPPAPIVQSLSSSLSSGSSFQWYHCYHRCHRCQWYHCVSLWGTVITFIESTTNNSELAHFLNLCSSIRVWCYSTGPLVAALARYKAIITRSHPATSHHRGEGEVTTYSEENLHVKEKLADITITILVIPSSSRQNDLAHPGSATLGLDN